MLGPNPRLLGAGAFGEAFLNSSEDLVMKFAFSYDSCESLVSEALALTLLESAPGVQRLVGMCLEKALIVTRYAGPTLQDWKLGDAGLLPRDWLYILSKVVLVLMDIHECRMTHNDVKSNNVCARKVPGGFEVTVIDFGMATLEGQRLHLVGRWEPGFHNPPEFFRGRGGEPSRLTDAFSLGRLLQSFLKVKSPQLRDWIRKSQSPSVESREGLDELLVPLAEEAMRCL